MKEGIIVMDTTVMDIELITVLEAVLTAFLIILIYGFIHRVFVMLGIPEKIHAKIQTILPKCLRSIPPENKGLRAFGEPIVGTWYCKLCGYHIFPNELKRLEDTFLWSNKSETLIKPAVGPHCKKCNTPMDYDESA